MKMNKQVQIRMPLEMYAHLQKLAEERAPGTTPALLIREAIHQVYFQTAPSQTTADQPPKKSVKA